MDSGGGGFGLVHSSALVGDSISLSLICVLVLSKDHHCNPGCHAEKMSTSRRIVCSCSAGKYLSSRLTLLPHVYS